MVRVMARRAVLALVAAVVGWLLLRSNTVQLVVIQIGEAFGRLRPETVALVLALSTISMLISGGMWCSVLKKMGYSLPMGAGMGAFAGAGLAGYVASTAGSAVGGAVSLRRHGVCASRAVALTMIANALGLCGVLVWAPVGLVLISRAGMSQALPFLGSMGPLAGALALAGLSLLMLGSLHLLTRAPEAGQRFFRRLTHRDGVSGAGDGTPQAALSYKALLALVPWSAISWFVGALALYVTLDGLAGGVSVNLADVVGAAALAAVFGSLAFFLPAGVGVRDGVLVTLLAHSTGIPMVTCTAAAIAVRALDPVTKVGLCLIVASGAHARVTSSRSRMLVLAHRVLRFDEGRPALQMSLARLSIRLSSPLREAVRVEYD